MGAALGCVDVVDIGEKAFGEAVGILDGGAADDGVPFALDIDDIFLEGVLAGVEVADVVLDAAVIAEDPGAAVRVRDALVREGDADAAVQVGQLLQAAGDGFGLETDVFKDLIVREEADQGALLPGVAQDFQRACRMTGEDLAGGGIHFAGEGHAVVGPVQENVDGEPLAQRVHDGSADAVETAGIVVILVIEFAAGVENGEDDFDAGLVHGGMLIHGHAAAVVPDTGGAVLMKRDGNFGSETVGGFVDGVVHNLPQQMVKAAGRGRADIHTGAHTDGFEAIQHLDVTGVVGLGCQWVHSFSA